MSNIKKGQKRAKRERKNNHDSLVIPMRETTSPSQFVILRRVQSGDLVAPILNNMGECSPVPNPLVKKLLHDDALDSLVQQGGLSIIGRMRESLKLAISWFIYTPGFHSLESSACEDLKKLLYENKVWQAYHHLTLINQSFCNVTKVIFFLDARKILSHAKRLKGPFVLEKLWEEAFTNKWWLRMINPDTEESDLEDNVFLDGMENEINKCMDEDVRYKFPNAICDRDVLSDTPSVMGTYLHTIATDLLLPLLSDELVKNPYPGTSKYVHLPGRYISKGLPVMTSTPDGIVSPIDNAEEFARVMCEQIDERINHLSYYHAQNCNSDNRARYMKAVLDQRTRQAPAYAYIEIKTLGNPSINKREMEIILEGGDEQHRKVYITQIMKEKLVQANKMIKGPDARNTQARSNVFAKGNNFVYNRDMGQAKYNTEKYPLIRYPPRYNLGPDDINREDDNERNTEHITEWNRAFPRHTKAVLILFDVDSPENKPVYIARFNEDDVPILLCPQSSFAMQMAEQQCIIGRQDPSLQGIFVAIVKAEKQQYEKLADDEKFRANNRMGLVMGLAVEFDDEIISNIERLVREQMASNYGHTKELADYNCVGYIKQESPHIKFMRDNRLKDPIRYKPAAADFKSVAATAQIVGEYIGCPEISTISCIDTGLPFKHATDDVKKTNLMQTGAISDAELLDYCILNNY